MIKLFRRKKTIQTDRVMAVFQSIVDMIKDLDKKEIARLQEGITLVWQGYQKVKQAQTTDDKISDDIDKSETFLEIEK